MASKIADLKRFFGFESIAEFKAEWDELTKEEQEWFKEQDLS